MGQLVACTFDSYFIYVFREFLLLSFRTLEVCVAHRMYLQILSVGIIYNMRSLPKDMLSRTL